MSLTSIWERQRPKRRVRLTAMTDKEIAMDDDGWLARCTWCRNLAIGACSANDLRRHVSAQACDIFFCRTHAHWRGGKPYCARHAREV